MLFLIKTSVIEILFLPVQRTFSLLLYCLFRMSAHQSWSFVFRSRSLTLRESYWRIYRYTIDKCIAIYGVQSDHTVIVLDSTMHGFDTGTSHQNVRISV